MKCKRIISIIMAALCLLTMSGAFAYKVGEARVAIGANLDSEQIAAVYSDFGIERGVIPEITVTNENERQYLEGLVDDKKIGHKAISCVYITILDDGSGLNVSTKNINWCTEQMYKNALTTAGITDADVKVTAPFEVSGTAALTGIYKAYEDITGNSLSSLAKMVGAEELIVTGQLAEYIGSDEATALINELKGILDITETMSDADVKKEKKKLADQYNVQVTDGQIEQLLKLCRQLEKLDELIEGMGELGEITREQTTAVDMTDTYTDNASRLESARAKKQQLDALYAKAENMEDIITLTNALFDVQEEIDALEGQNRQIDHDVNLATLVVSISEKSSAVNAKQPFLTRLGKEFSEGLEHFGEFVSDSVLALTYALPWLALLAVVIAVVRAVVRKKRRKKSQKDSEVRGRK